MPRQRRSARNGSSTNVRQRPGPSTAEASVRDQAAAGAEDVPARALALKKVVTKLVQPVFGSAKA